MSVADNQCELCRELGSNAGSNASSQAGDQAGGDVLWGDTLCRVLLVADADYPGYCRVIWNDHEREMTDLTASDRRHLMSVVYATEAAVRACLNPDKINLASLGNQVPHVHWHVIPRWQDDRHFPQTIWGQPQRESAPRFAVRIAPLRARLIQALAEEQGGEA